MSPNATRYNFFFNVIHWVLILVSLVLLGLGWYIKYMPPTPQARKFLFELHISLGLTIAILIFIQIFLWILFKRTSLPNELKRWKDLSVNALYAIIYFSLVLILVSGYLQAVFGATPVEFWGVALPVWGVVDVTLAAFFGTIHGLLAFALVGSILAHVCVLALNFLFPPSAGGPTPPLAAREPRSLLPDETRSRTIARTAQKLARTLTVCGWLAFGLQFVLAFISGLLLAVATSGRAFSPGAASFGDAIYWAGDGFLLLCLAILVDLYYIRAARKISLRPNSFFHKNYRISFWFLAAGMLIGLAGIVVSFIGVALSTTLLIAKTVSQPPGIAITDPSKIIRALDVFLLLVNFCLLSAHFIGSGVALWLTNRASKALLAYLGGLDRRGEKEWPDRNAETAPGPARSVDRK